MTQITEMLAEAKNLISDPRYWIKGCQKVDDSYCAIGALKELYPSYYNEETYWDAARALARNLPGDLTNIVSFNDDPTTTHEDIMNLFDRAIERSKR